MTSPKIKLERGPLSVWIWQAETRFEVMESRGGSPWIDFLAGMYQEFALAARRLDAELERLGLGEPFENPREATCMNRSDVDFRLGAKDIAVVENLLIDTALHTSDEGLRTCCLDLAVSVHRWVVVNEESWRQIAILGETKIETFAYDSVLMRVNARLGG